MLKELLQKSCELTGATCADIYGRRRHKHIIDAKRAFIHAVRLTTTETAVNIAEFLQLDHSSICHHYAAGINLYSVDKPYKNLLEKLVAYARTLQRNKIN